MSNSQIQQGTYQSTQTGSFASGEVRALTEFIRDLKHHLLELHLKIDDQKETEAEIATIEAQLSSSRPKSNIIKECLRTLKSILESAIGSVLTSEYLPKIEAFLTFFK